MDFHLIDILVSLVTAMIMFSVGLSLTISDFRNIFLFPKAISIGLVSQMLVLPVIAFIITYFSPISNEFKIGLIILSASPGGATSGIITYLLKGNIALSISLTAINSFLTLFSIPLIVNAALIFYSGNHVEIRLPFLDTIIQIFMVTILPAAIGIAFRKYYEKFSLKIERHIKVVMIILLLIVFVVKFFANESHGGVNFTNADYINILPYALLLNISCLLCGFFLLKTAKLPHADCITACIESGVHNTPMAILIAGTIIANQEMVKPVLLYALFSFWTALLVGYLLNLAFGRRKKRISVR
jgi:bile acid:Na+ symporter, BASS family